MLHFASSNTNIARERGLQWWKTNATESLYSLCFSLSCIKNESRGQNCNFKFSRIEKERKFETKDIVTDKQLKIF